MDESSSEGTTTCRGRLCKKDKKRFVRYIGSTTTHGVSHVFLGKSYIRRLFWLVVVLASASGCLYNCINRIVFLAGGPTSTTISNERVSNITFPAVTICNANAVTRSFAVEHNLTDLLNYFLYTDLRDINNECQQLVKASSMAINFSLSDITYEGRHRKDDFIVSCLYLGEPCDSSDFIPTFTRLGLCYTFNSGFELRNDPTFTRLGLCYTFNSGFELRNDTFQDREPKITSGTGTRYGLRLSLNIEQDEYTFPLNLDAGVRIAVHPQSDPAEPDDTGIAIPPGRKAFIGVRQAQFEDTSSARTCRDVDQNDNLNFLRDEFGYSSSACNIDCFYTQIADQCNCTDSSFYQATEPPYSELPECTITDLCCEAVPYFVPTVCDCPAACSYITYSTSISYSAFPANVFADSVFSELTNGGVVNLTQEEIRQALRENFITVDIYFEDLNINTLQTSNAYDAVALLSDIGGQLGLFLGASVISIMEFVVWILDETKDRTCGLSSKKLQNSVDNIKMKKRTANNGVEIDDMGRSQNEPNA